MDYSVKELKEVYGEAEEIPLTEQTIKELVKGLPVHTCEVILVPPKAKWKLVKGD